MPIIFALMIVMIGAQVIASIYALINPFIQEMGDIQNYNQAYYGAIAGVERAELVLKNHTAGFEGSGGFINKNTYGPNSDFSNIDKKYFGLLALTGQNNGIFRSIKNLNTDGIIPSTGNGDLDPDISSGNDFYQISLDRSIQLALYKDVSGKDKYYTGYDSVDNIKIDSSLAIQIRVPQKIYDLNGTIKALDDKDDIDGDGIGNDIIVNRSLFGYTGDNSFTIIPSSNLNTDGTAVANNDTNIREDVINEGNNDINIEFNTNSADTNPCVGGNHTQNVDKFNQSPEDAVSTGFDLILNNKLSDKSNNYSNTYPIHTMNAKFSVVNLLKKSESKVYPYLEIKVKTNKALPDVYFHILGEGKVGAYDVRIKIPKSVFNVNAASDFTVLF